MALVAQGLKVIQRERSTALVDGDDVVDHLGRDSQSLSLALLAERILLQFESAKAPPPPALVEVGVVVLVAGEGFLLREPRAMRVFLDAGHDYFFLKMDGRPGLFLVWTPFTSRIWAWGNLRCRDS